MLKKGFFVTIIFVFSTLVQLVSQIVVTRTFGARIDLDIFLAAVALPTIIVTVIYGTLNDAFLPIYGEKKIKDPNSARQYLSSQLFFLTIFSFLIAWIMGFISPFLSRILYQNRGEIFIKDVAVQMSYMFYCMPLSIIATLFGAYYYAEKKFNRFPLAQLIGSLTNLLMIVILAPMIGTWSLVIAFVLNIAFQILFVLPPLPAFSLYNFINFRNFITILIVWLPLIIGNFALRSDTLLIRSFASGLKEGYLVYLNLIAKIFSLATGMITIGIQILQLPHLIEYFAGKNYEKAFAVINKSKIVSVGLSILVTLIIMLLAPIAINLLFVGGKFTRNDADLTASLIPMFLLPAIGWGVSSVFFQPLLALKKQLQLSLLNVIALLLAWSIGSAIKFYFGPLPAISSGLIILLFTGIIGSELLWQYYKKKLIFQ